MTRGATRRQGRRLVAAASVAVAAASCGGAAATPPRTQAIELGDYRFTPNRINARVGVSVTLTLVNRGTVEHDLNFQSLHMPGLGGVEAILAPGETRTVSITFDQPGEHQFVCTLPGHAAAGMTGAAFVTP